jgi:phosphoribosylformylglycinamidine cyclo-ligase
MDYREAGVDVEAGRQFVGKIKDVVAETMRPEVLGGLGGFSGLFRLPKGFQSPVLVSGTDGVGTKLKLAQEMGCHHTVGIDLVAMCVNDVLTSGAEPLFFLDYLATSKLEPDQLAQVVGGIAEGCKRSGCALLGGETAEMPGFYQPQEYDLAGFCVGVVEESKILDGSQVQIDDVAVGLASQGVHSNGFSLVRKIVKDRGLKWSDRPGEFSGQSLGDMLLTPTQLYVKPVLAALQQGLEIHGMAHITGGGLPENLPRALGVGQAVELTVGSWPILPIFEWLAAQGNVAPRDMYETFNMGIGFVLLVPPHQLSQTVATFSEQGIPAYPMGKVTAGERSVVGLPE